MYRRLMQRRLGPVRSLAFLKYINSHPSHQSTIQSTIAESENMKISFIPVAVPSIPSVFRTTQHRRFPRWCPVYLRICMVAVRPVPCPGSCTAFDLKLRFLLCTLIKYMDIRAKKPWNRNMKNKPPPVSLPVCMFLKGLLLLRKIDFCT